MIEIGVIHAVTRVNVEDPQAIKAQREILEDYRDRRLYDRDRTHWQQHQADLDAAPLRGRNRTGIPGAPAAGPGARATAGGRRRPHRRHRADLDEAITAITEIEKHRRLDDARATQERFAERMQPTIADIKANLRRMNEVTRKLIDEIAEVAGGCLTGSAW